ncbi:MAG: sulfatase-like hydrolase/transferase, partial [Gammaproteobacteria bacterium]
HYTIDSLRGLASFVAQARVEQGPPTLKFLHLMNTHRPINMNRACSLDPWLSQTREHYKVQARCGIDGFLDLLAFLKRSSLYEETLVILLSDHGAALGSPSRPYALDGAVKLHSGQTGKFVPLLLVKPPLRRGPLKVSQAPASLIDVRATVCEAAKICDPPPTGRSVLSLAEDVARERQFIDYRVFARDIVARDELTEAEIRRFATRAPVRDLDLVTDAGGRPIAEKAVPGGVSVR